MHLIQDYCLRYLLLLLFLAKTCKAVNARRGILNQRDIVPSPSMEAKGMGKQKKCDIARVNRISQIGKTKWPME